jgi:glucose 1-dehydrogenase
LKFKDKVVIVTGAASGIGHGIMQAFAREGAIVINADINGALAEETCAEVRRRGFTAEAIVTDISNQSQVEQLVSKTLSRFGKIDILVNNAGVSGEAPFLKMSLVEWTRVIGVNLQGQFLTSQLVARVMVEAGYGGKIVNITSINEDLAGVGLSHYCASKGGLRMLTKVMALELAPYKINVNAVAPGIIETRLTASALADAAKKKRLMDKVPWSRIGQPGDVAAAVLFLASEDADYITGASFAIDGGWLIE